MKPRPAKPFLSRIVIGIVGGTAWLFGLSVQFGDWRRVGAYLAISALLLAVWRLRC